MSSFVFERLTDSARRAIRSAERWSRDEAKPLVPEAILLGILREQKVAYHALRTLRVDLDCLTRAVGQAMAEAPAGDTGAEFTSRAVIDLARDESQAWGHNYIGTEHLLLALLREPCGRATSVLRDLGYTVDQMRAAVRVVLQ